MLLAGHHRRTSQDAHTRWVAWTFWLVLATGLGVAITMLAAMLPVFGHAVQHELKELHEQCAIALLVVLVLHVALRVRRRVA